MVLSLAQLQTIFSTLNFGGPAELRDTNGLNSIALLSAGGLSDAEAIEMVGDLVNDTTSVAALTYQFFTGSIPTQAGFFFLVNDAGDGGAPTLPNTTDLNDEYYDGGPSSPAGLPGFNQENRYYNFAINLGTGAVPSAGPFAALYGNLSFADAVAAAYETIIGTVAATQAGINVQNALDFIASKELFFRQVAIERAGGRGTNDINVKAIMVGFIMNEAVKAEVGNYAAALNLFLADLANDGNAAFGTSLTASYPPVPADATVFLTTNLDSGAAFTTGAGNDSFLANNLTLTQGDDLIGGGGTDILVYSTTGFLPVNESGFETESIEVFQLTIDNFGGTNFDVSGATGLVNINNTNSSNDLVLTGLNNLTTVVSIQNTSANVGGSVDTTINFTADATDNANDAITVNLVNVTNPITLAPQTTLFVNGGPLSGVETISLGVTGNVPGGSQLWDITPSLGANTFTRLNIAGSQDLRVYGVNFGQSNNIVDASTYSGNLGIILDTSGNPTVGADIAVSGGSGSDTADFTAGFDGGDSFDGNGSATDKLLLSGDTVQNWDLNAGTSGSASDLEIAHVVTGDVTGDHIYANNLGAALTELGVGGGGLTATNVNTFIPVGANPGVAANTSLSSGGVVSIRELLANGQTTVVADLTTLDVDDGGETSTWNFDLVNGTIGGGSDIARLNLQRAGTGTVLLQDVEISSAVGVASQIDSFFLNIWGATGTFDVDVAGWGDLETLTVSAVGSAGVTVDIDSVDGSPSGLTTFAGGGSSNSLNLTDLHVSSAGVSITTGSGNDTVGTGFGSTITDDMDGNDTINAGSGNDIAWGGLGADAINGQDGHDTLWGQQGTDTITGGNGNDQISGGGGLDNLTGGAGLDTFRYDLQLDSYGPDVDVITDFEVGSDFIDLLPALMIANPLVLAYTDVIFVGNVNTDSAGDTALIAGGAVSAYYNRVTDHLNVDVDGDGDIDDQDMVIQVNTVGNVDLTAASIGANFSPVTFTASTVGFDTSDPTTSTEGNVTTTGNDVINTTFARLAGATVDGEGGTDILNITDQINVAVDLDDYTVDIDDIDRLALRAGSTDLVSAPDVDELIITLGASSIVETNDDGIPFLNQVVQGSNQNDTITLNNASDQAFGRNGNDVINVNAGAGIVVDAGDGNDTVALADGVVLNGSANLSGGVNDTDNDVLFLGDNADISAGNVNPTTWEDVQLDDDATMTLAQHNALQAVFSTFGNPFNELTIVGAGSLTTADNIESYVFDSGVQQVTLGDNDTDIDLGSGNDVVFTNGFTTFSGVSFVGGGGTDTFQVTGSSVDLTSGIDPTFSSFEVLGLSNNLDATMTNSQHASFSSANGVDDIFGDNQITITNAFTGTTFNTIEVYQLNNVAGTHNFNVGSGVANQVINNQDTDDGQSVNVLSGTNGVTYNSNTSAATTYTASSGSTNLTLNLGSDIDTITLGGTHTGISITDTGGIGDVFNFSNPSTVSGTITGGGTDILNFADNTDVAGTTFSGFSALNLASSGDFTINENLWEQFVDPATGSVLAGQTVTAPGGAEDVYFTSSVSTTALTDTGGDVVENYNLLSAGNDNITFFQNSYTNAGFDVRLTGGGTDTVRLVNVHDANVSNTARVTFSSFTAGAAGDNINWDDDGVNIGQNFFTVGANSDSNFTGANGALIEITSGTVNAAGAVDVSANGTVEGVIAAAIGDASLGTLAAGDNIGAIIYDFDGNAYLYSVLIDAAATLGAFDAADFSVELVGVLNAVGTDALDGANFV